MTRVGVLALQGDVREHSLALAAAGATPVPVKRAADDPERPLFVLALLADAGRLIPRGREEIDFTQTTRYAASARGLALDLWLDHDGLPRRIVIYEGPNTRTVVLSDFLGGQPVGVPVGAISVADLPAALKAGK